MNKHNYILPDLVLEGFCTGCKKDNPVYKTYGLSHEVYEWLCPTCMDKVLIPLSKQKLKNCISCSALLFDESYYKKGKKKEPFCRYCELPNPLLTRTVREYGAN